MTKLAWVAPCLLLASACADAGSCLFTTTDGYDYCVDYLGEEYKQDVAQFNCSTGNGTYSDKHCAHGGALGTCAVPVATGKAQNVEYTYYVSKTSSPPATSLTVETACGLVGGAFTAD